MKQIPLNAARPETPAPAKDISVLILTFNESRHIERAIASVAGIAREVVVVDSFSTDDTVDRATRAGARVIQNRFVNQSKQFQFGLDHCDLQGGWIMRLDADEVIEADLAREITRRLPTLAEDIVGVNLNRKHIFMGRWVRHGGRYPLRLLRLWRAGQGRVEERWMDEHIVVWGGRTITIDGGFADVNLNDLSYFTAKHNSYATREAIDRLSQRYGLFPADKAVSSQSASLQAAAKRFVKENIYNRLPLGVGPTFYFLYRYLIQMGFLDGKSGLVYHFLQGYWYRFLADAKTMELEREIATCLDNDARVVRLAAVTGLNLTGAA